MAKKIKEQVGQKGEAEKIDIEKYMGKWFEIASVPAWFQRKCENTTAEYTPREGFVEVKNTCTRPKFSGLFGKREETTAIGKAFLTDQDNLLKVQFAPPFKAPYEIDFVDEKYQRAIVSSGKYLWILAREPDIPEEEFNALVELAREKGRNILKLEKTKQKKN